MPIEIGFTFGHKRKEKNYICTSALPMVNKLGRVVTYGGENQPPKSRVLLIM